MEGERGEPSTPALGGKDPTNSASGRPRVGAEGGKSSRLGSREVEVTRPNAADLEAESMVTKHPIYQVLTTLELRIYTNLLNVFRANPSWGRSEGESRR